MSLKKIANATIPPAENNDKLIFKKGNTDDIVTVILQADAQSAQFTQEFADAFDGLPDAEKCEELYYFVQDNIRYKEDPAGEQWVKSPSRLWADKVGDCKSFSLFIGSVLKNCNIPFVYRFVAFTQKGDVTHVYVVAYPDGEEIILDAVPPMDFNQEHEDIIQVYDYKPNSAKAVAGIHKSFNSGVTRHPRLRGVENSVSTFLWLALGALLVFRK